MGGKGYLSDLTAVACAVLLGMAYFVGVYTSEHRSASPKRITRRQRLWGKFPRPAHLTPQPRPERPSTGGRQEKGTCSVPRGGAGREEPTRPGAAA